MALDYTGDVNTNGEYVNVETITSGTLTAGDTYSIQVINHEDFPVKFKEGNAVFTVNNEKFTYTASSNDLYIKTDTIGCTFTILG